MEGTAEDYKGEKRVWVEDGEKYEEDGSRERLREEE